VAAVAFTAAVAASTRSGARPLATRHRRSPARVAVADAAAVAGAAAVEGAAEAGAKADAPDNGLARFA
jgi:hypothetical protein